MIGTWKVYQHQPSGYDLRTVMQLQPNHRFSYRNRVIAGAEQNTWAFSGRWELRNQILMLLINKSNFPGRPVHQVLFWRLLRLEDSTLVYVRTGSQKLSRMSRLNG